jgi:holo-[acyl-carrier protein] synthase
MTVTIGVDLVHVPSFAELLGDRASAFAGATFSDAERAYATTAASGDPARHLAARYAAKEAALKALDHAAALRGVDPPTVSPGAIEVLRDARGRPSLALHGAAGDLADRLGVARASVSLSHDGEYALAFVTLTLG